LEDLLDARAVAKTLGITVSAVHRLAARGTLPSNWLGGRRIWKRAQVAQYLADQPAQARRRASATVQIGGQQLELAEVVEQLRGARLGGREVEK
jgi:predicted DNA-binding transcriptional regulator AlpA